MIGDCSYFWHGQSTPGFRCQNSHDLAGHPLVRHSRLKELFRPRRGIATRYLDNYLIWFHLVDLAPGANDRACLAATITK